MNTQDKVIGLSSYKSASFFLEYFSIISNLLNTGLDNGHTIQNICLKGQWAYYTNICLKGQLAYYTKHMFKGTVDILYKTYV